jgi:hypothetical protein
LDCRKFCGLIQRLLGAHKTEKFGADLVNATFIGLAFLLENGGDFGTEFEMRFGLLLDFDVDHFFQQT